MSDGAWAANACPPADNTTKALFRCILARHELGESDFIGQDYTPTDEADRAAQEHLEQIQDSAVRSPSLAANLGVLTAHFTAQLHEWATEGQALPRVYPLRKGYWGQSCDYSEHNLGYRYMMEHWFRGFILENPALLVDDVDVADYVYLPHCATGMFMHITAAEVMERPHASQHPLLQGLGRAPRRGSANASGMGRREEGVPSVNLVYEGNLLSEAVRRTDDRYLMNLLIGEWSADPAFQHCERRSTCRFLIPSIYGRHVWRRFAETFGDKAVFVTHSGMSEWLSGQQPEFFLSHARNSSRSSIMNPRSCRRSCLAHCVVDPPSVLSGDIVLPWTIWYQWTPRATHFASRDLLAFYSGTDNSCSRKRLNARFHDNFELNARKWGRSSGATVGWRRLLIFPPTVRLRQEEWSEFAFRSRICIVPDGDSPNTGRLIEVIMHGCVPMIVSDRLQPPMHEYIDWSKIAFFVREESIKDLPSILADLATPSGNAQIAMRHALLAPAAHMLSTVNDGIGAMFFIALRDRLRALRKRHPK